MVSHSRLGNSERVLSCWLIVMLLGFPLVPAVAVASGSKPFREPIPPGKVDILHKVLANAPKTWSEWKLAGDGMELVHSFLAIRREIPASAAPALENARVAEASSIIRLEPEPGDSARGNAPHETESAGGTAPSQGDAAEGPTRITLTRLVEGLHAGLEIKLDADGAEVTLIRSAGDTVLLPGQPQEILVVAHLFLVSCPAMLVEIDDVGFVVAGGTGGFSVSVYGPVPVSTLVRIFEEAVAQELEPNEAASSAAYFGDLWFPMRVGDAGTGRSDPTAVTAPYGEIGTSAGYLTSVYDHRGTDFVSKRPDGTGRPIYPVWDNGQVFAKRSGGVYGNFVTLRHRYIYQGISYYFESLYAHLDSFDAEYSEGDTEVPHTEKLGISGTTGASRDIHLHLEFRKPTAPTAQHQTRYPAGFFYRRMQSEIERASYGPPGVGPGQAEDWELSSPITGRTTLTVVKRLEKDVWQVRTNDNGTLYAIKLAPGNPELDVGDQVAVGGRLVDPLYPGGPLVLAVLVRKYVPGESPP